ncbi:MAG: CatB-related O-acetyltransferase [Lachnospiraceae bacterium]|nr:CatB-related O-acetyltransferase [Lachnospiraceae bacterium]
MRLLSRKIKEISSILYRRLLFPFKRLGLEMSSKSIMLPGSYVKGTHLSGRNYLGKNTVLRNCFLGFGSYVNNNGDLTDTDIGKYTSIGTNVSTVIGKHPLSRQVAMHPAFTISDEIFGFSYTDRTVFDVSQERTVIGNDVWIGNNVLIIGGVRIGDGAVVGAGSVVTKDIEPYSINAGVPAKKIRYRFEEEQISSLLKRKWWDDDEALIRSNISRFYDIEEFLK